MYNSDRLITFLERAGYTFRRFETEQLYLNEASDIKFKKLQKKLEGKNRFKKNLLLTAIGIFGTPTVIFSGLFLTNFSLFFFPYAFIGLTLLYGLVGRGLYKVNAKKYKKLNFYKEISKTEYPDMSLLILLLDALDIRSDLVIKSDSLFGNTNLIKEIKTPLIELEKYLYTAEDKKLPKSIYNNYSNTIEMLNNYILEVGLSKDEKVSLETFKELTTGIREGLADDMEKLKVFSKAESKLNIKSIEELIKADAESKLKMREITDGESQLQVETVKKVILERK